MTDTKQDAAPKLTPEQQMEQMLNAMQQRLPEVMEVAKMYNRVYPGNTTNPDVLRAVTIPTPLTTYMLLVGIVSTILLDRQTKAAAANDGTPA